MKQTRGRRTQGPRRSELGRKREAKTGERVKGGGREEAEKGRGGVVGGHRRVSGQRGASGRLQALTSGGPPRVFIGRGNGTREGPGLLEVTRSCLC